MRVLVAMSGGVDSSVTAALLLQEGHEVVGATMKLWGGSSDSGCCSVADVEDARRVAQQLGIDHHVFNFSQQFDEQVVKPYVDAHTAGETPNPCVECNRHLKFDRFFERAEMLGFDAIATGHHARVVTAADGSAALARAIDDAKDQSYVLHMIDQRVLRRTLLPIGEITKTRVREIAEQLGMRTADKPDSQDVCFIMATNGGRETFLGDRIALRPATVHDQSGREIGTVDALELVTVGQRRGLTMTDAPLDETGSPIRRYALQVDADNRRVVVGTLQDLGVNDQPIGAVSWINAACVVGDRVMVQSSAHGRATPATFMGDHVAYDQPTRRVAPGQMVVLYSYDNALVLGGAAATRISDRVDVPA
jgi:tRNA-specific 2-thiouridylase